MHRLVYEYVLGNYLSLVIEELSWSQSFASR